MYAIETIGLTKTYKPSGKFASMFVRSPVKEEIFAVSDVNLQVKQGELFGLIGPNGAGKTTLTKMLCTLLWPTSGTARIYGYDAGTQENEVKANIGFVASEERSFYWRLSGRQNLAFFAALNDLHSFEANKRITEVLRLVGLEEAADNMVYSYSSGMKQKLSIARGLLNDPNVLFLDEPTRSLDPIAAREIKQFIKTEMIHKAGKTAFLTSHRLEEVEELCDRFAIIDKGQITFCGTLEELRSGLNLRERYILRLKKFSRADLIRVMARNQLEQVAIDCDEDAGAITIDFAFPDEENGLAKLIADVTALGAVVVSCERLDAKLEDMFFQHVSNKVAQ